MNSILNDEATEFEGRTYVNPNLTVEGTNQFIDNYRALQSQNNAEISNQTQNLGTDIQSNLGGLLGGKGYWTSRYQTPQTNQTLQNLRTIAQAAALNTALANEKAMWEKRYKDAYRNYQKRQNKKQNTTTPTTNPYQMVPGEETEYESTTPQSKSQETSLSGVSGARTVVDPMTGAVTTVDMNTGNGETLYPGETSTWRTPVNSNALPGGGYIERLPNGNTVWVRTGYTLVKDSGKYYLQNNSNGDRTEVGGY